MFPYLTILIFLKYKCFITDGTYEPKNPDTFQYVGNDFNACLDKYISENFNRQRLKVYFTADYIKDQILIPPGFKTKIHIRYVLDEIKFTNLPGKKSMPQNITVGSFNTRYYFSNDIINYYSKYINANFLDILQFPYRCFVGDYPNPPKTGDNENTGKYDGYVEDSSLDFIDGGDGPDDAEDDTENSEDEIADNSHNTKEGNKKDDKMDDDYGTVYRRGLVDQDSTEEIQYPKVDIVVDDYRKCFDNPEQYVYVIMAQNSSYGFNTYRIPEKRKVVFDAFYPLKNLSAYKYNVYNLNRYGVKEFTYFASSINIFQSYDYNCLYDPEKIFTPSDPYYFQRIVSDVSKCFSRMKEIENAVLHMGGDSETNFVVPKRYFKVKLLDESLVNYIANIRFPPCATLKNVGTPPNSSYAFEIDYSITVIFSETVTSFNRSTVRCYGNIGSDVLIGFPYGTKYFGEFKYGLYYTPTELNKQHIQVISDSYIFSLQTLTNEGFDDKTYFYSDTYVVGPGAFGFYFAHSRPFIIVIVGDYVTKSNVILSRESVFIPFYFIGSDFELTITSNQPVTFKKSIFSFENGIKVVCISSIDMDNVDLGDPAAGYLPLIFDTYVNLLMLYRCQINANYVYTNGINLINQLNLSSQDNLIVFGQSYKAYYFEVNISDTFYRISRFNDFITDYGGQYNPVRISIHRSFAIHFHSTFTNVTSIYYSLLNKLEFSPSIKFYGDVYTYISSDFVNKTDNDNKIYIKLGSRNTVYSYLYNLRSPTEFGNILAINPRTYTKAKSLYYYRGNYYDGYQEYPEKNTIVDTKLDVSYFDRQDGDYFVTSETFEIVAGEADSMNINSLVLGNGSRSLLISNKAPFTINVDYELDFADISEIDYNKSSGINIVSKNIKMRYDLFYKSCVPGSLFKISNVSSYYDPINGIAGVANANNIMFADSNLNVDYENAPSVKPFPYLLMLSNIHGSVVAKSKPGGSMYVKFEDKLNSKLVSADDQRIIQVEGGNLTLEGSLTGNLVIDSPNELVNITASNLKVNTRPVFTDKSIVGLGFSDLMALNYVGNGKLTIYTKDSYSTIKRITTSNNSLILTTDEFERSVAVYDLTISILPDEKTLIIDADRELGLPYTKITLLGITKYNIDNFFNKTSWTDVGKSPSDYYQVDPNFCPDCVVPNYYEADSIFNRITKPNSVPLGIILAGAFAGVAIISCAVIGTVIFKRIKKLRELDSDDYDDFSSEDYLMINQTAFETNF